RVGGFGIARDLVLSASAELLVNSRGQSLLDVIGLRLVYECRYGDGAEIRRQQVRVARGVITAAAERREQGKNQRAADSHCTCPLGREADMTSAHSTAVIAAIRRLSKAAHSHTAFGSEPSGITETRMSPWPAALTLFGDSCDLGITVTCSPIRAREISAISAAASNLTFIETA